MYTFLTNQLTQERVILTFVSYKQKQIIMETLHNIYHKSTNNLVAANLTTKELDRFFRTNYKHTYDKPVYRIETFYKNKFHRFMHKYDYKFVMFTLMFLLGYLVTKLIQELWMI